MSAIPQPRHQPHARRVSTPSSGHRDCCRCIFATVFLHQKMPSSFPFLCLRVGLCVRWRGTTWMWQNDTTSTVPFTTALILVSLLSKHRLKGGLEHRVLQRSAEQETRWGGRSCDTDLEQFTFRLLHIQNSDYDCFKISRNGEASLTLENSH